MSAPPLEARHLRCEREERLLFSALDMSLEAGELLRIEPERVMLIVGAAGRDGRREVLGRRGPVGAAEA